MGLLVPAFLAAAAVTALPLVLHLLRIQPRRRIPFPSLRFLGKEALSDSNRQRLQRWITLLLRCLAILCIVVAFARPFWPLEHSHDDRAVVVVLDNSYSMQAAGRVEAVQRWLAPQLDALRPPDQLGVLVLHPAPTWLVPLTTDLDAGRQALREWTHAYETTHYQPGLDLAGARLALTTAKRKQILLAGDQQWLGWRGVRFERTLPPGVQLFAAPPAAAPTRQAAIIALTAARTAEGLVAFDVTIRNYADESQERSVTFHHRDAALGTESVVLEAGRATTLHAEFRLEQGEDAVFAHATLSPDELAVDDTSYIALGAVADRRVMLAPAPAEGVEADYLRLALEAVADAGQRVIDGSRRSEAAPAGFVVGDLPVNRPWSPTSVAVLRGASPFRGDNTRALDAFLAAGGAAWLICDGSPEQAAWLADHGVRVESVNGSGGAPLKLRDFALEHPLFAPFATHSLGPLMSPTFHRGQALDGSAVEPLARWPDRSVAIAEVPAGAGRLLITGFRETRADSTFPTESGYVPFVHHALHWLGQSRIQAPMGGKVGETFVLPGAGVWRAVLTPGPVETREVDAFVTPEVPGLYAFEPLDGLVRYYAVNLDTAESDLSGWPAGFEPQRLVSEAAADDVGPAMAEAPEGPEPTLDESLVDERHVWWWLLAAALVLLLMELALANRTFA